MTLRRPLPAAIVLVFVLAVALSAVAASEVTAVAITVVALCAAAACLVRAGRRRGRMRLVWAAFGLAALAGGVPGDHTPGCLAMIPAAAR